jgi:cytochrome bd-type quinol oxidase subunit 2
MRSDKPGTRRAVLGGLAAAGIVIAHGVGYALAEPDPHVRLQHLAATGHAHWSFVVVGAIALLVGGLALYLSGLVTARREHEAPSFVELAWRLAALQTFGFLALEASERLASGGLLRLFDDPAVVTGLLLQILFAALGAALLALLTTGVAAVLRRRRALGQRQTADSPRFVVTGRTPLCEVATGAGTVRGPPLPV